MLIPPPTMLPHAILAPLASAVLASAAPAADAGLRLDYAYSLATTTGVVPFAGVALSYDRQNRELLVVGDGLVRIFGESGMEIYTFGDDPSVAGATSVAALDGGDIALLSYAGGKPALIRCNYRGDVKERFGLSGLPEALASFRPSAMRALGDRLYFADYGAMLVIVSDLNGAFVASYDLAKLMDVEDQRREVGLRNFNVSPNGDVLFTVQPLFQVGVLSPDGTLRSFGVKGSAPGKFNIVGGVAGDEQGNIFVTDILRSVVMVFDPGFNFIKEFGYRGRRPGNLAAPEGIVVGNGQVFVAQNARRGVSVFKLVRN